MVGADVLGRPPPAQGRCRRTMRPRGPPRTSAPTNAAHHMTRNAAHSRHAQNRTHHVAQGRIHGRVGRPRPPDPRTRTTPEDDASARAAGDVGPYQRRTALVCRAAHTSCGAQGRMHGRGGRPRPPALRTHKDDAGGRCVRAGRRGRRPLPTPHSRDVQGRAAVARRAVYMVGADVPGRPPRARTRTTPVDDASARAAEDVGPYQRRTAVACRTARTMWRAGRRCARHTYRCGISSPV